MTFIRLKGKTYKVISEKLITGYIQETTREMKARQKKLLPLGSYQYMAIKVKQ